MSEFPIKPISEQENAESKIESMSESEMCVFLDKLASAENKNNFSQEYIDTIIKRIYEIADEDNLGISNNLLIKTLLAFSPNYPYNFSVSQENVSDKAYRAIIKFHNIDVDSGRQLIELFAQNNIVNPRIIISIASDLCANPKTGDYVISDIVDSLNYVLSFSNGEYDELLINQLDFDNPENFFRTVKMLDFLQELLNVSSQNSFSTILKNKLINLLERVVKEDTGSYLLIIKVKKILSGMRSNDWSNFHFNRTNIEPFDIQSIISRGLNITEEDLTDFQYIMNSDMRSYIEKEFNVELNSLSDLEKFYFLKLIKQKDKTVLNKIKQFVVKFGSSGFKSFIAIDYGSSIGDVVLRIDEKLDKETAQKVFDKYSEFIDSLDSVENILLESYGVERAGSLVVQIRELMLKKGKALLDGFSEYDVLSKIDDIEVSGVLFFLAFKQLKADGMLPNLEDIKNISLEKRDSSSLSKDEIEIMKGIYRANYSDKTDLLDDLLKKFEERLTDGKTVFYLLTYQNQVKAFVGFTPNDIGLYFHSVNVDENLRGISIGNTMMEKALDKESEKHILEADCAAYEAIGARYVEGGCIADSFYLYKNNPSLHIVRNNSNNKNYWGKRMVGKESDLIGQFENGELPDGVVVESSEDQKNINMSLLSNGFVLSRYFKFGAKNRWYAVFEKAA